MRRFFRLFGFDDFETLKSQLNMGQVRVAVICTALMIASSFAPLVNMPHIYLDDIPTDLKGKTWYLLTTEVIGLALNLAGKTRWAWGMLAFTYLELFAEFRWMLNLVESGNKYFDEDPLVHYADRCSLAWGWIPVLLGPAIMTAIYIAEYVHERRTNPRE